MGIRPEHMNQASHLISIAFKDKFVRYLGTIEQMTRIMKDCINPNNAITAISPKNELMGILGFTRNSNRLLRFNMNPFINEFGLFGGSIKYGLLKTLYKSFPTHDSQIMVDPIAVNENFRSLGIGKKLFNQLELYSRENKIKSIALEVIDENPKAYNLYEKIGFAPVEHHKIPQPFSSMINVTGVTKMVKSL